MADNYLEKKMEEHRMARMGARRPKKLSPAGQRPGKLVVDYPPLRVYVQDGVGYGREQEAIVKAFCDAACRVAFCGPDRRAGAQMAQRCGAQYHPVTAEGGGEAFEQSMRRVRDNWGEVDVTVAFAAGAVALRMPHGEARIQIGGHTAEQVAAMCVFLAGPKGGAWTVC